MYLKLFIISCVLVISTVLTACSGGEVKPNANTAATNGKPESNKANVTTPTVKTPEPTTNDAPTVGPVFKAYCDALTKKDEAALRKIYSSDTLKSLEDDMKADGEKSLVKFLETEQISNKVCEVRNEKIEGETAVAEVKTEGAPNGFKVKFVKENGAWKVTNQSPDIDSVKKSAQTAETDNVKKPAANTNTAK